MDLQHLEKEHKKERYNKMNVKIYYSRASFPISFAIHPWIVINDKERWEVTDFKPHIKKNYFPAKLAWAKWFWRQKRRNGARQKTHLLYEVTGEKAKEVALLVRNSKEEYPHKK